MEVKPFELVERETERFLWATETECPVCGHEVRIHVKDVLDRDETCTGRVIEFWRTLVIAYCRGCSPIGERIVFDLLDAKEYASKEWIDKYEAEHKAAQDIERGRTPKIQLPPNLVPFFARFSFIQEMRIKHRVATKVLEELAARNTQQASS